MSEFKATSDLNEKFAVMSVIVDMIDGFETEVENLSKATSNHEFVMCLLACETRCRVIFEIINKTNTNLSIFEKTLSEIMDKFKETSDRMAKLYKE